jgi:putative transposase
MPFFFLRRYPLCVISLFASFPSLRRCWCSSPTTKRSALQLVMFSIHAQIPNPFHFSLPCFMPNENNIAFTPPDFITITCLGWKYVLDDPRFKKIILDSLRFLTQKKKIHVYAFVIMTNHMHLIWQMCGEYERQNIQRDFLKYTAHQILRILKSEQAAMFKRLQVDAMDREYQLWERNSLSIPLYSHGVFLQKLNYIHRNPVAAGMCAKEEEYQWSSAAFHRGGNDFGFLVSY